MTEQQLAKMAKRRLAILALEGGLDQLEQLVASSEEADHRVVPGTFQSCSLRNRLDYILLSSELAQAVTGGGNL